MKKAMLSLVLLAALTWSCNNSKKEEKKEPKDSTTQVQPAPVQAPDSTHQGGDSTGKGEQQPPPKN